MLFAKVTSNSHIFCSRGSFYFHKVLCNFPFRRNEIILNKTLANAKGIVIVAGNLEDEKLKRFSTGVVEYGRVRILISFMVASHHANLL